MYTKIIHLHLPKTAGSSINRWLDLLAPAGRVRPPDYDSRFFIRRTATTAWAYPFPESTPDVYYDTLGRESRAYWDIIHGHAHSLVSRHPSTYCFVILRDPTSRLLSFLRDWRRLEPSAVERLAGPAGDVRRDALTCTANEFLERHAGASHFRLLSQAHVLCGAAAAGMDRFLGRQAVQAAASALRGAHPGGGVPPAAAAALLIRYARLRGPRPDGRRDRATHGPSKDAGTTAMPSLRR